MLLPSSRQNVSSADFRVSKCSLSKTLATVTEDPRTPLVAIDLSLGGDVSTIERSRGRRKWGSSSIVKRRGGACDASRRSCWLERMNETGGGRSRSRHEAEPSGEFGARRASLCAARAQLAQALAASLAASLAKLRGQITRWRALRKRGNATHAAGHLCFRSGPTKLPQKRINERSINRRIHFFLIVNRESKRFVTLYLGELCEGRARII